MIGDVRVLVGVNGSLSSLAALFRAVEEAQRRDALLVPVIAWSGDGDADGHGDDPLRPASELEHAARRRLDTAFELAFGGYPQNVVIRPVVERGEPGPVLVRAADRPSDVLVLGCGGRSRMQRALHGSVTRYCRAHARCEVLVVEPAELLAGLELVAR